MVNRSNSLRVFLSVITVCACILWFKVGNNVSSTGVDSIFCRRPADLTDAPIIKPSTEITGIEPIADKPVPDDSARIRHERRVINSWLTESSFENQSSQGIQHALYINLDARRDRRDEIFAVTKAANISAIRIPGINVSDSPELLKGCWDGGKPNGRCAGKIGCQLSHLRALDFAIRMEWPHVAIFEDDFAWLKNTDPLMVQDAVKKVQNLFPDWNVIALSLNIFSATVVMESTVPIGASTFSKIIRVHDAHTTHGYMVRRCIMPELYLAFRDCAVRSENHAIDTCWKSLMVTQNWYGFRPQLGTQRPSFSDIEGQFADYDIKRA